MAMSTQSASALTRGTKRLKDLATDAITIPSAAEIYKRKVAEIEDAKAKLSAIVAKQIRIEKGASRRTGDTEAVLAEKRDLKAQIARLSDEAATIKAQFAPKPKLSPQQQFLADALKFDDVFANRPRGTPAHIAEAQTAVDALVHEYKLTQPTGNANAAWTAKYHAAHLRLAVLQGLPYSARTHRLISPETLKAARKAEELE